MAQRTPRPHHRHQKRQPSHEPLPTNRRRKTRRIPGQSARTIKNRRNTSGIRQILPKGTKLRHANSRSRSKKQTPQSRHRLLEIPLRNHGRTTRRRKPNRTRPQARTRNIQLTLQQLGYEEKTASPTAESGKATKTQDSHAAQTPTKHRKTRHGPSNAKASEAPTTSKLSSHG